MTGRLRALVVDDEPVAREGLTAMLDDHPGVEVVGAASTGEEAVRLVRAHGPDVLFLDIRLPDLDGFQVLEHADGGPHTAVVFVTAFQEHAARAFDVGAVDYLVKPFGDRRLAEAVERVRRTVAAGDLEDLARVVQRARRSAGPPGGRLAFDTGSGSLFLAADEVDWIEADGDYVRIHAGERTHLVSHTLTEMEDRLDPRDFVRIHRSTIVRVDRIRDVTPLGRGDQRVRLVDGTELRLARRRRLALERILSSPDPSGG